MNVYVGGSVCTHIEARSTRAFISFSLFITLGGGGERTFANKYCVCMVHAYMYVQGYTCAEARKDITFYLFPLTP